jgi:arylamine N-acetyltransferase
VHHKGIFVDESLRNEAAGEARSAVRVLAGDAQLGNNLCLLVRLDQPYLIDVGFGGSLVEPLPLKASEREDAPYRLGLSEPGNDYWRFSESARGDDAFSFEFRVAPGDEALFARKCQFLQTDPLLRLSRILSSNAAQPKLTCPCAAAFWRLFIQRVSTRSC